MSAIAAVLVIAGVVAALALTSGSSGHTYVGTEDAAALQRFLSANAPAGDTTKLASCPITSESSVATAVPGADAELVPSPSPQNPNSAGVYRDTKVDVGLLVASCRFAFDNAQGNEKYVYVTVYNKPGLEPHAYEQKFAREQNEVDHQVNGARVDGGRSYPGECTTPRTTDTIGNCIFDWTQNGVYVEVSTDQPFEKVGRATLRELLPDIAKALHSLSPA